MTIENRSTALVTETSRSGTATRRKSTVVADSSDDADDRDDRDDRDRRVDRAERGDRANNNNNDDDDDDDDFKSANDDVEIRSSRKRESTSGHVSTTKRRAGSASASSGTLQSGTSAGRRAPLASASAPHARSSASAAAASSAGSSKLRFDNDTSDNNDDDDDDDDDTDDDALVQPHTRTSNARATSGRDTQRPAASDSMSCPICGEDFSASEIEAHADVCASQLDGSFNADVRDIPAKSSHSRSGVSVRHVQTTIDGSDGKLKRPSPAAAAAGERLRAQWKLGLAIPSFFSLFFPFFLLFFLFL
jgi:hypothetical protein